MKLLDFFRRLTYNEIVNVVPFGERRDLKIDDKVIYNRRLGNYSLAVL